MSEGTLLLIFVTLQRWGEFHWDRDNTRRLVAQGAVEVARTHYPLLIIVHAGWLAGVWLVGYDRPIELPFLVAFLIVEVGRAWVLWSLGRRWTTRIIVLPGAPLVAAGPYRLTKHPNYVIVAAEMVLVPARPRSTRLCAGGGRDLHRLDHVRAYSGREHRAGAARSAQRRVGQPRRAVVSLPPAREP